MSLFNNPKIERIERRVNELAAKMELFEHEHHYGSDSDLLMAHAKATIAYHPSDSKSVHAKNSAALRVSERRVLREQIIEYAAPCVQDALRNVYEILK